MTVQTTRFGCFQLGMAQLSYSYGTTIEMALPPMGAFTEPARRGAAFTETSARGAASAEPTGKVAAMAEPARKGEAKAEPAAKGYAIEN